jgi:hypothetical protein
MYVDLSRVADTNQNQRSITDPHQTQNSVAKEGRGGEEAQNGAIEGLRNSSHRSASL